MVNGIHLDRRDLTSQALEEGRQVFNLHIGYYIDPITHKFCGIADDSKKCIPARCVELGCFPTLKEVLDAILEFLKKALKIIGIVMLAILIALIAILLGRGGRLPAPSPVPVIAETEEGSMTDETEAEV